MEYLVDIDIGGTHTDGVVIDQKGQVVDAKVPSTPEDFSKGFFNTLELMAKKLDLNVEELLSQTNHVSHGTTVGTNAVIKGIEGQSAETALITTIGTESVLSIMRGALGRSSGLPIEEYLRMHEVTKPDPLIPKDHIYGINERIDCMGDVVVEFDGEQAYKVAQELAESDIKAVAVSFLWSFLNDNHESEMMTILKEELDNEIFLTQSSELVPTWGEYERTAATVINAVIGPTTSEYIQRINDGLEERGYDGTLLVMKVDGGVAPAADAIHEPIRTIDSGPVAGVTGSSFLGEELGDENIIAADMGGTSFDVGLITDGTPITKASNVIHQYDYNIRNIDIESVGNGGGSIAWIEEEINRLRVGPQSAGADPGPACYRQGGENFTITDADLLCGFLEPDHFLGGRKQLDVDAAESAVEDLSDDLGMDRMDVAQGVIEIANAQMADLLRQQTINKGYDPRRFSIYAYGGAGPLHLPAIAQRLDIDRVVIPIGDSSAVWSAVGLSSSDILYRSEVSNIRTFAPFDSDTLSERFEGLEEETRAKLLDAGFDEDEIQLERYVNLSYGLQVHEVTVPAPQGNLTDDDVHKIITRFEQKYQELYGEGAGASETGFELVTMRVDGYGPTTKPNLETTTKPAANAGSQPAKEKIFWPTEDRYIDTTMFYEDDIYPGLNQSGPAVVRLENTTIAVPPNDTAEIDEYGNVIVRNEN